MAIIGSLPVLLANNTLADATQVMSDLNYIISQTNANAAGLAQANNFAIAPTFAGDGVMTLTGTQTATNKTFTAAILNSPTLATPVLSGIPTGSWTNAPLATPLVSGYLDRPDCPASISYRSSNQTLPLSATTTVIFDTESVDRTNSYDNTTGIFTAPHAGIYQINVALRLTNATLGTATFNGAFISKNNSLAAGSFVELVSIFQAPSSIGPGGNVFPMIGNAQFLMAASDTIRTVVVLGAGANMSAVAGCASSINFLG